MSNPVSGVPLRAPRRCAKPDCREFQPCPIHGGWKAKKYDLPSNWGALRKAVWIRDRGVCQECGIAGKSVDHTVPRYRGGTDTLDNLRLLCGGCHKKKSDLEKNHRD